jgi:2,4-dienoyl-CoA reductase-like NADH-dependent reductase (Old Yellow Enzyme family)
MADNQGRPQPRLAELYRELAEGGVGLIITGHMYIHPSGHAHEGMTGIYDDALIPKLATLADSVHQAGGRVVVQINHGGMQCEKALVPEMIAPSATNFDHLEAPSREITVDEIHMLIEAYGDAAKRVKEAGFDGVQIHAAHGYLISVFLSPLVNKRNDSWGGDPERRMRFLREVSKTVRSKIGPDFPMLIKLGMMDGIEGGLTLEAGAEVVAELDNMGFDGIELSGGVARGSFNSRKGIRSPDREAYFRPLAEKARPMTPLPIILVGGFRTIQVMEQVLEEGTADFISICRPLISEPDLPNRLQQGIQTKSRCLSSNNCWPDDVPDGIACKCPHDKVEVELLER